MRSVLAFVFALAATAFAATAFASPALAQDGGVVQVGTSALQVWLQQGITGAIAVVCLIGFILKDRQLTKERELFDAKLTKERDAWTEKIMTVSMAHAADSAKTMLLMERLIQLMERLARYIEKGGV